MKFAFLIMGDFSSKSDRAAIHNGSAQMNGVGDIEEACSVAKELYEKGIGCIELCGAFGAEGAKQVKNKIPVGYITHLPEQDEIYRTVFPNDKS